AAKLPWSIVRKELTSCLEVACLYSETTRAMASVKLSVPTPELYTDNEANYHRLVKAFKLFSQSKEYDVFRSGWKSSAPAAWELRTLFKISQLLVPRGGKVFHLPGKRNPSDYYSRGLTLKCLPQDDPLLIEAVSCARGRPSCVDDNKLSDDLPALPLSVVVDDDSDTIKALKDYVCLKQKDDPELRSLLCPSPNSKPDSRTLRKYSVVIGPSGRSNDGYVINSVTRGLVVPRELRREVCDRLHLYFIHLGAYKIYRSIKSDFDAGPLSEYLKAQKRC
ncbi:hypothetical protein Pmar_PMAR013190, partial [Perkinsus marinus ATCC 50983]